MISYYRYKYLHQYLYEMGKLISRPKIYHLWCLSHTYNDTIFSYGSRYFLVTQFCFIMCVVCEPASVR